ncbi:MAG: trypsin-like peptidase domain-containing protein [Hydrogenothermaceae bacterium]|nr:trypsin-like peptidase domain-containing protein [Hydrogenothermaceae bacterium]
MDSRHSIFLNIKYIYFATVILLLISSCEKKREKDTVEYLQYRINYIVNQTSKSIVTVYTKGSENVKLLPGNQFDDESVGSGFVFKKDFKYIYVVTNSHVIEKSKNIKVKFYNGRWYKAELVGKDDKIDIAVLRIPLNNHLRDVYPLKMADRESIRVGNFVLAAGSPYNLGISYTFGIVSALDRDVGISQFEGYIQTDAPINPGDSGGPLLDMNGRVIGMNIATVQTGQGLGFAIPVDILKYVTNQLVKYGKVDRGFIGITVDDLSEDIMEKLHIENGVIVIKVQKNSPAMKAGIKSGDIILKVNSELIKDTKRFNRILLEIKSGQFIEFEILRNGHKITISLITEKS